VWRACKETGPDWGNMRNWQIKTICTARSWSYSNAASAKTPAWHWRHIGYSDDLFAFTIDETSLPSASTEDVVDEVDRRLSNADVTITSLLLSSTLGRSLSEVQCASSQQCCSINTTPCLCLKKLCQLIFCSVLVKYEPISIKIGRHVLNDTTNKSVQKVPTSLIMCASTTLGNFWSVKLSCQRSTYMYILMNHWIATKPLAVIVSRIVECVVSHIILTSYARNVCLQNECKHVDAGATTPTARSINAWYRMFTRFDASS